MQWLRAFQLRNATLNASYRVVWVSLGRHSGPKRILCTRPDCEIISKHNKRCNNMQAGWVDMPPKRCTDAPGRIRLIDLCAAFECLYFGYFVGKNVKCNVRKDLKCVVSKYVCLTMPSRNYVMKTRHEIYVTKHCVIIRESFIWKIDFFFNINFKDFNYL